MRVKIKSLLVFFAGFVSLFMISAVGTIKNEYVSPEYLYLDKGNKILYIGLSTSPGIAIYDIDADKISGTIRMPAAVSGIIVDVKENILYAGSRGEQGMVYVYDLKREVALESIKTGHGPVDLEIADKERELFIANRYSNDISVINLDTKREIKRIEVIREPVALAISQKGNILAVANLLPSQPSTDTYISSSVTLIDLETKSVIKNIELSNGAYSLRDLKFSNDGKYIYISHLSGHYNVLTSQIEKGWINTNALSIIDVEDEAFYTTVLLDDIYKGAANPGGLNITEDGKELHVAISGTHELFIIDLEGMHYLIESTKSKSNNSQTAQLISETDPIPVFKRSSVYAPYVEPLHVMFDEIPNELGFLTPVRKRIQLKGMGASQVVNLGSKIFITSYFSDGIDLLEMKEESIESKFINIGKKDISESKIRYGELLFHNAENCFQQWQSCSSCHPGGGRVDGLNWDLMNDGIGNPKNTKSLLYSHQTPPATVTGIRKDAETGVRAGFKYIQFFDATEEMAQAIDAYLKSLKPVLSPYLIDSDLEEAIERGEILFQERNCKGCHSGTYFTDMQQYEMGEKGKYDKQNVWDTPSLIELWRTAPYMHDGRYYLLEEVFNKGQHGLKDPLTDSEISDLTIFLKTL